MQISEIPHWFKEDRAPQRSVGRNTFSQDHFEPGWNLSIGLGSVVAGNKPLFLSALFINTITDYRCSGVFLQCLITHSKHRYFKSLGEKY